MKKQPIVALSLAGLFTIASLAPAYSEMTQNVELKGKIQYQQNSYILGPGDVLSLKVLHEPDFTQEEILIRPDGQASVIGVGEIQMANESLQTIKEIVETKLSETMLRPEVLLTVKSMRPATVYISGAILHPGMFQFTTDATNKNLTLKQDDSTLRTDMRLCNILANAGGVTLDADLHHVVVTRAANNERVEVDLWKVIKEGKIQDDIWLNSGDQISIPKNGKMALSDEDYQILLASSIGPKFFPVRVIGSVATPGVYNLESVSPYLNSALAKAGSFVQQANKRVVAIRRFSDENTFTTLFIDMNKHDIMLRPNDVVYISENKLYKTSAYAAEVSRILSPFQSAAMTGGYSAQMFGLGGWKRAGN